MKAKTKPVALRPGKEIIDADPVRIGLLAARQQPEQVKKQLREAERMLADQQNDRVRSLFPDLSEELERVSGALCVELKKFARFCATTAQPRGAYLNHHCAMRVMLSSWVELEVSLHATKNKGPESANSTLFRMCVRIPEVYSAHTGEGAVIRFEEAHRDTLETISKRAIHYADARLNEEGWYGDCWYSRLFRAPCRYSWVQAANAHPVTDVKPALPSGWLP